MRAPLIIAAVMALPCLFVAAPVAAQQGPGIRPQQQPAVRQGPAPALPGLAARRAPAPIPGDPAADLSPNAALFDAIGRGDIAAARDAVSRGATLEARNALGLTPLDAAVDQGRNDIVFYLLSTRDVSRGQVVMDPSPISAPPAAAARAASPREPVAAAMPATPRNARLWAGEGGAPRPEVGFLGFDAGRPAGGAPAARAGRS